MNIHARRAGVYNKGDNLIMKNNLVRMFSIFALCIMASAAISAQIVVTPTNTQGWSTADTNAGGAVNFVVDPSAPSGNGALQLTTDGTTTAKAQYMHVANVPLSSITELSYWTRQLAANI